MPTANESGSSLKIAAFTPYIPLMLAILGGLGWAISHFYTYVTEQPSLQPTEVVCSEDGVDGCTEFSIVFKNSGKGTASDVRYSRAIYSYGRTVFEGRELSKLWAYVANSDHSHVGDIENGKSFEIPTLRTEPDTDKTRTIVFGEIVWKDQWSRRHLIEYCTEPEVSMLSKVAQSWDIRDSAACKKDN